MWACGRRVYAVSGTVRATRGAVSAGHVCDVRSNSRKMEKKVAHHAKNPRRQAREFLSRPPIAPSESWWGEWRGVAEVCAYGPSERRVRQLSKDACIAERDLAPKIAAGRDTARTRRRAPPALLRTPDGQRDRLHMRWRPPAECGRGRGDAWCAHTDADADSMRADATPA